MNGSSPTKLELVPIIYIKDENWYGYRCGNDISSVCVCKIEVGSGVFCTSLLLYTRNTRRTWILLFLLKESWHFCNFNSLVPLQIKQILHYSTVLLLFLKWKVLFFWHKEWLHRNSLLNELLGSRTTLVFALQVTSIGCSWKMQCLLLSL